MADTYTEGYRIGFITCNKDISKKSVVQVLYPLGFERMIRAALKNFEEMGMKPAMRPFSTSVNKQFEITTRRIWHCGLTRHMWSIVLSACTMHLSE